MSDQIRMTNERIDCVNTAIVELCEALGAYVPPPFRIRMQIVAEIERLQRAARQEAADA